MNEHPILFSSEMMRAILMGNKTQTRRVIKTQPEFNADGCMSAKLEVPPIWYDFYSINGKTKRIKCPYVKRMNHWVRETFAVDGHYKDGKGYCYRADGDKATQWKPSIFMPRQASRIILEVTDIRVERVQNISDGDIGHEGISWNEPPQFEKRNLSRGISPAQRAFCRLWDEINFKRGFSWEKNPWVWVIEFKPLDSAEIRRLGK